MIVGNTEVIQKRVRGDQAASDGHKLHTSSNRTSGESARFHLSGNRVYQDLGIVSVIEIFRRLQARPPGARAWCYLQRL